MKVGLIFIFMMTVNILCFFTQVTLNQISDSPPIVFNYDKSALAPYDAGNFTLSDNVTERLPNEEASVEVDGGNVFTDTFRAMKNWLTDTWGYRLLVGVMNSLPNLIKMIPGVPAEFVFAFGALWQGITLIAFVALLRGY